MNAIFDVRNLKRTFGGLAVTNDVSLSMAPGDRVARKMRGGMFPGLS